MGLMEIDFRRAIRKHWDGWFDVIEPSFGMSDGIPDLLLWRKNFRGANFAFPFELKMIDREDDLKVFSKAIRPAQIRWNLDFPGRSFFFFGRRDELSGYVAEAGPWLNHWRKGISREFLIGMDILELCTGQFLRPGTFDEGSKKVVRWP